MEGKGLRARLEIDGNKGIKYEIQDFDYEFSLSYNNNYKPSDNAPHGGIFNFTILSPLMENLIFHDWLLKKERKSGKLILPISHGTNLTYKKFMFYNAYCVRLSEQYSYRDTSRMQMRLSISAQRIEILKDDSYVKFLNKAGF